MGAVVALGAGEDGHVLDHAKDLEETVSGQQKRIILEILYRYVDFSEHCNSFNGIFQRDVLGSRDNYGSYLTHQLPPSHVD